MGEEVSGQRSVLLDRVKLCFQDEGEGPILLLLHGLPGPGVWERLLPHLRGRLHCICPHTLGLGDSQSDARSDYQLEAQAEWIRRFLDRAKLERVHVLGHDLGGVVAMALATRYPHRIGKLILSHVPPRANWEHPILRRMSHWASLPGGATRLRRTFGSARGWEEAFNQLDPASTDWSSWAQAFSSDRAASFKIFLRENRPIITATLLEAIRGYQRPTMLLWGCDFPPLSPSWAIQLYHEIPGATRFELIPFSGHFPQWESPERFARAVLDFVAPKSRGVARESAQGDRPQQKT